MVKLWSKFDSYHKSIVYSSIQSYGIGPRVGQYLAKKSSIGGALTRTREADQKSISGCLPRRHNFRKLFLKESSCEFLEAEPR